jgi:hypothetical protein
MDNASVEDCVVRTVRQWKFPKPQGGGIVTVSYPFNFTSDNSIPIVAGSQGALTVDVTYRFADRSHPALGR